jgi:hypothetical protein
MEVNAPPEDALDLPAARLDELGFRCVLAVSGG